MSLLSLQAASGQEKHMVCRDIQNGTIGSQPRQLQGPPGKRGVQGFQGPRGLPGVQGRTGSPGAVDYDRIAEMIEEKVSQRSFCSVGAAYGGSIPDSSFSASSEYNNRHGPRLGRVNTPKGHNSVGSWCPRSTSIGEWIQVDLGRRTTVVGVIIQGRPEFNERTHSFHVACGLTRSSMRKITDENGTVKLFSGNSDPDTVITHFFKHKECQYLRIYPRTWANRACLRMDFIKSC